MSEWKNIAKKNRVVNRTEIVQLASAGNTVGDAGVSGSILAISALGVAAAALMFYSRNKNEAEAGKADDMYSRLID